MQRLIVLTLGFSFLFCGCALFSACQSPTDSRKTVQPSETPQKTAEPEKEKLHSYRVKVETTKGDFVIAVNPEWSPNGAAHFKKLVEANYYEDIAIFRAIAGFMFQFGIHGNPTVNEKWNDETIDDDRPKGISNQKGYVTFAKTGAPNSRSTQLFINLGDNANLDGMGFTPIGKVIEGIEVIDLINTEYGENKGNIQGMFEADGNEFIKKKFPNLDYIKSIKILPHEA